MSSSVEAVSLRATGNEGGGTIVRVAGARFPRPQGVSPVELEFACGVVLTIPW